MKNNPETAAAQFCGLDYYSPQRLGQYYYQIKAIRESDVNRILEIGPGPGVVTHILRTAGMNVKTFDCEADLKPDVCGDIRAIPLADNSVDFTLCCQVLEHLPFEDFKKSLSEIKRVTAKFALISLPYVSRVIYSLHKLPTGRRASWVLHFPWLPAKGRSAPGHFWEIGRKGYSQKKIRHSIKNAGLYIREAFTPVDAPNNQFFLVATDRQG
ncbi:class I SAM-dependent methyltransferase [bacterium]|nr:class I SAM-dependent methyltransferase [bacterium]